MDNLSKKLTIVAAIVVIAAGSQYLWNVYQTNLEARCKSQDGIVSAWAEVVVDSDYAPGPVREYNKSVQDCVDRGGPYR